MNLGDLRRLDLAGLETLYSEAPLLDPPAGLFRGAHLTRLQTAGSRKLRYRAAQWLPFEHTPWGIDFDSGSWFFFTPRLHLGAFEASPERSRWRPTETLALRYDRSRLPSFVRERLYDEVKPLTPDLCLGIGGVNATRGEGDHFFFALVRPSPDAAGGNPPTCGRQPHARW